MPVHLRIVRLILGFCVICGSDRAGFGSRVMVIDGGLGSAEQDLPGEVVRQQIMPKTQFDFCGFV